GRSSAWTCRRWDAPRGRRTRCAPSAPQFECCRQQGGEGLGHDLALAQVDDAQVEAELRHELPAGATGRAGARRVVGGYADRPEPPDALAHRPHEGAALGADREAVRAVLDVDTLERATVLRDQDGADGELRVGRVGALTHLASPLVERAVVGCG